MNRCRDVFSMGAMGALAPSIFGQYISVTTLYLAPAILGQSITVSTRNSKILTRPLHHHFLIYSLDLLKPNT